MISRYDMIVDLRSHISLLEGQLQHEKNVNDVMIEASAEMEKERDLAQTGSATSMELVAQMAKDSKGKDHAIDRLEGELNFTETNLNKRIDTLNSWWGDIVAHLEKEKKAAINSWNGVLVDNTELGDKIGTKNIEISILKGRIGCFESFTPDPKEIMLLQNKIEELKEGYEDLANSFSVVSSERTQFRVMNEKLGDKISFLKELNTKLSHKAVKAGNVAKDAVAQMHAARNKIYKHVYSDIDDLRSELTYAKIDRDYWKDFQQRTAQSFETVAAERDKFEAVAEMKSKNYCEYISTGGAKIHLDGVLVTVEKENETS